MTDGEIDRDIKSSPEFGNAQVHMYFLVSCAQQGKHTMLNNLFK